MTREDIKQYRLMDNFFMKIFFSKSIEAVQLILQVILDRSDIEVTSVKVESDLCNLAGKSVVLDIHAKDSSEREFDVEIQRSSSGASPQRAGYHLSQMHSHMLDKNEDYSTLKDAYVIFITETDTIGEGAPISVFETQNVINHRKFDDKRHIIYVNGKARCHDTELGRLMEDFFCEDPNQINYPEIRARFKYLKETKEGEKELMDYEEKYTKAGEDKKQLEIAINLINLGTVSLEDIATATGLDIDKVRELAGQVAI